MNKGIIITPDNKTAKELTYVGTRTYIDSHLVAMRLAGVEDIYVVASAIKLPLFSYRFSQGTYSLAGIFPRLITLPFDVLTVDDIFLWSITELGSKAGYTFISEADKPIEINTFQKALYYTGHEGIRLNLQGITLSPPVVDYIARNNFKTIDQALNNARKIYDEWRY